MGRVTRPPPPRGAPPRPEYPLLAESTPVWVAAGALMTAPILATPGVWGFGVLGGLLVALYWGGASRGEEWDIEHGD